MTFGARLRVLEQQLDAMTAQLAAIREQVAVLVSEAEHGAKSERAATVTEFRFPKAP